MTTQPNLISAEVIESSRQPPPKREDWYIAVYLTPFGNWTLFKDGGRAALVMLNAEALKKELDANHVREYRIVRIPGEGQ